MQKSTLGVIVGNRGFFPSHLCETGRRQVLRILAEEGIGAIVLDPADTPQELLTILKEKLYPPVCMCPSNVLSKPASRFASPSAGLKPFPFLFDTGFLIKSSMLELPLHPL